METPTRPAITTCFHLTPPDRPQKMSVFLREAVGGAIKRKTSFEISPRLAKRAFVDPAPGAEESVLRYQMRHDVDKLHVHIPNPYGEMASALKRSREIARLHSFNLYRLYAANTLSDFIRKAIALKGAKKSSMKGKAIAEVGQAAATYGSSDRLRRAADTITAKDLQGWGLDGGEYRKLLSNSEKVRVCNLIAHLTSN